MAAISQGLSIAGKAEMIGFCDLFSEPGLGLKTCILPCCTAASIESTLGGSGTCACLQQAVCCCLFSCRQRSKVRKLVGLDSNCLPGLCCPCCSLVQTRRQLDIYVAISNPNHAPIVNANSPVNPVTLNANTPSHLRNMQMAPPPPLPMMTQPQPMVVQHPMMQQHVVNQPIMAPMQPVVMQPIMQQPVMIPAGQQSLMYQQQPAPQMVYAAPSPVAYGSPQVAYGNVPHGFYST